MYCKHSAWKPQFTTGNVLHRGNRMFEIGGKMWISKVNGMEAVKHNIFVVSVQRHRTGIKKVNPFD